ncbi:hypothetical protein PC119_g10505 [Phytophthora cactorum]|nr:hypothetical protein PC119_g10505 [Phytophthora cactorum]
MAFKAADVDPCVWTRGEDGDKFIVCLYANDMLIATKEKAIIASVKADIAEKFKIKDIGRAHFILGITIDYDMDYRTLRIRQQAHIESIINKFGQDDAKTRLTPLEAGVHLTKVGQPQTEATKAKMRSKPYRLLVGRLMYLACGTRPDILTAVAQLCRFLDNPGQKHWDAGIRVVCYVLTTKDVGITYDGHQVWRSTFQKPLALRSTEAEYMTLSDCMKEVVRMRLLPEDIGLEQCGGAVIYEDNQRAIALAKNVGYQAHTNHIDTNNQRRIPLLRAYRPRPCANGWTAAKSEPRSIRRIEWGCCSCHLLSTRLDVYR